MFGANPFGWFYFAEAFLATSGPARVSQVVAEAVESPTDAAGRVSQVVAEAVESPNASLRASQVVVEIIDTKSSPMVLSQIVTEVIYANTGRGFTHVVWIG